MTDDFPFKLDRILEACGWSPPCQPYTTGRIADLKPLMIDASRNVYEFGDMQTSVAMPGPDGYPTVGVSAAYHLAAGIERLLADDGECALVIDAATHRVELVEAARLMMQEGANIIVVEARQFGKTAAAEDLMREMRREPDLYRDVYLNRPAPPDRDQGYLRHDPTKNHRRRRNPRRR